MNNSEDFLNSILNGLRDGIIILNNQGKVTFWNSWLAAKSAISNDLAIGRKLTEIFELPENSRLHFAIEGALDLRQSSFISHSINPFLLPLKGNRKTLNDNKKIAHHINVLPIINEKNINSVFIQIEDITTEVAKENLLKEKAALLENLNNELRKEVEEKILINEKLQFCAVAIEHTAEAVVITDSDSIIQVVNPAFTNITGYTAEEAIGKKVNIIKSGLHNRGYYKELWSTIQTKGVWNGEFINRKPGGQLFTVESSIVAVRNKSEKILHFVNVFHDITERKEHEKVLVKMSTTDSLTGLANRRTFDLNFKEQWNDHLTRSAELSLLMIDVDHFKLFNDTYGHIKGDDCLCSIANVIKKSLSHDEDLGVRYGGEEFVIILPQTNQVGAITTAKKILKSVEELDIEHKASATANHVTISVGITSAIPQQKDESQKALEVVDEALYKAKNAGRNQTFFMSI